MVYYSPPFKHNFKKTNNTIKFQIKQKLGKDLIPKKKIKQIIASSKTFLRKVHWIILVEEKKVQGI